MMMFEDKVIPTAELSEYHAQQARRLRALAKNATTAPLKARLLEEAKKHERFADEAKRDEC
jgi:hypothetical protein